MSAFAGLNVLVTGASGGLGSAMVAAFLADGAQVIAADLTIEGTPAPGTEAALRRRLDVSDEASWIGLLDEVDGLGGLHVLVNNAGIYRPNIPFEEMPIDLWRQHFAVNSDGVFLGCKHAILRMKARGIAGAIVNMGSGMSIKANPTGAAYCATKAAVLMTTKTAAAAAGRYGIRVNAVLPGAVPTTMLLGNMAGEETEDAFLSRMATYGHLGRLATPEDIARGVLFLADPRNAAISGVHLPIDGCNLPGS